MQKSELLLAWQTLWRVFGVSPSVGLCEQLLASYEEPHRRYHTLQHLSECMTHLHAARHLSERTHEVELALWFHDAIYAQRQHDNEARSAEWAKAVALQAGLSMGVAERIHALIMATCHDATPTDPDAQILVDIDLSILGADRPRFDQYEQQVRQEYAWVPGFLFRRKRHQILASFLARPRIFMTGYFFERLEAQARANLARTLEKLGA